VGQASGGSRLLDEAVAEGSIVGQMAVHDLDGDATLEPQIGGQIDRRHAAPGDAGAHLIAPVHKAADHRVDLARAHLTSVRSGSDPCSPARRAAPVAAPMGAMPTPRSGSSAQGPPWPREDSPPDPMRGIDAHHGILIGVSSPNDREWVTLPDLAEQFSLPIGKVRRLIEERHLIALRIDGVARVPAAFVEGTEPLQDLRGTIILLGDNGFSDDEAVDWLLSDEESLGATPVAALRAGRKAEVRRAS
jgi:hypothetical protein